MASKLLIKRSNQAGNIPTQAQLDFGELAINTYDGKLYLRRNNGVDSIIEVGETPPAPTGMQYFHGIATSGQTVFNLGFTYTVGAHSLLVFIQGVKQEEGIAYTEPTINPTANSITFTSPLLSGDEVEVTQIGGNVVYPNLTIANEGLGLTSAPTSINFTGGGVNATVTGSNVTVDVPTPLLPGAIGTTVQPYDAQLSSAIRQNVQSAGYNCDLLDAGKHIYFNTTGNYGIPANAIVAFPVGTVITFVNFAGPSTISCGDAMYLAGTGATGGRTLAQFGMATALKFSATQWIISGTGLT